MDNHSFPDGIHGFIAQHDNDTDTEVISELVPLDAQPTQPQHDVEINGEDSNTLSLTSFSDSPYEDHDNVDSESTRDAHEVEMQAVNDRSLSDHSVPNPSPTSHTAVDQPAVNNRRARVEDDEDDERDRRHPSQRIGNSSNAASSAGPSSSIPQVAAVAPQATPGGRLRGQAPIFTRTVVDEAATGPRTHPFRFFQHLMSNNNNNNDNNEAGNMNSAPSSGAPAPAPHQDGNTPDNQHPHGRIETFSVTVDIGLGPAFTMGGGTQPHEGQATANPADPNHNPDPNDAQNPNIQGISIADFMARLGQAIGMGDNGAEGTGAAPTGDNPTQGTGGAGATPGPQFGFNIPGGFNLANLAGLGFGFNFDGSNFGEKEDPERARKLVDGLEEVPVGLVRRLERIGGTGGGMGEDETKGGDGGCAICWDRLLGSVDDAGQKCEKKEEESERTQPVTSMNTDEASDRTTPKIVSLPCAHVFHAECLIPWFSRPRQTTCPTCRFNIDPENLTYVSWRRRMRERRERERAEAGARDPENADGNDAGQDGTAPPTAASAAEPAVAPTFPDAGFTHEQVLSFLTRPLVPVRSQTPDVPVRVRLPPSSSQNPASSSSSLSDPTPSTSQPTSQTRAEEGVNDWDEMPGLQDASDGEDEEDNEEDDDEDEDEEDGDGAHGIQAPPVLPPANEPPTTSTPGAQAQAPRPRQNDPLAPRTIQTAHGLITFIPVPFNFPFPNAGNGVGVGVQAGGNAATANSQAPPAFGQGQPPPNGNANVNAQALPQGYPLGFPHFRVQLPHMPEFGAQRGAPAPAPAPTAANTAANNTNANLNQAIPTSPFVNAQEAAAITHTEEHLMQHLRSQGLTTDDAENIRRSTLAGRQADLLRRGENPIGVHLEMEDDEDEDMMDIDEGMGMVVDLTMNQGGIDGAETGSNPAATMAQDELDRQDFDHVMNFFNHAARQAQRQAQAAQTQGQAQPPERVTQEGTPSDQNASQQPQQPSQQQRQPQQQQGHGFVQPTFGAFGLEDDRTINEFVTRMFANLGGPQQQQQQQQTPQQGPQAQGENNQPPPLVQAQPQPQAGQEPAEPNPANANNQPQAGQDPAGPNPANANNNNGGRPRQQAQFAFSNVTIGPFPNLGSLFGQVPMFNPNGTANANNAGAGQERVKKAWTLPPAPGPTLRQRIERRERDAGLRCYDISCGVGPSDEDPIVSDETIATGLRQLMIMSKNHGVDGMPGICVHTFHPGCLVSAERVALGGADVNVIEEGGDVEVSCPVCRSAGCVTRQEWEEGILALG